MIMAVLSLAAGSPLTNNQLDFAFVAELPVLPVPPKRARRSTRLSPASQASAQPANPVPLGVPPNPSGIEAMAVTLESHPDYRVIRRLKPRLEWPAAGEQGVCRVVVLDTETTGLDQSRDKIMEQSLSGNITANDPTASEAAGNPGQFTITRTAPTNVALTVNLTIAATDTD